MLPDSSPALETLSYEQAFAELEEIVSALESSTAPLDESMRLFERGQVLAQRCSALLDQADLKVQQLSGSTLTDWTPQENDR